VFLAGIASSWHTAACASVAADITTHVGITAPSELDTYTERTNNGATRHVRVSPALAIAPLRPLPAAFRENVAALARHLDGISQRNGEAPRAPAHGDDENDAGGAPENGRLVCNDDVVNAHWTHLSRCFDGDGAAAKNSFAHTPILANLAKSVAAIRAAAMRGNGFDVCVALGQHVARLAATTDGYQRAWTERDTALFLCTQDCTCGITVTTSVAMDHTGEREDHSRQGPVTTSGSSARFVRLAHAVVVTEVDRVFRERRVQPPPPALNARVDYSPAIVAIAMREYRAISANSTHVVNPVPSAQTEALFVASSTHAAIDDELSKMLICAHYPASVSHDRHDREMMIGRVRPAAPRPAPVAIPVPSPLVVPPDDAEDVDEPQPLPAQIVGARRPGRAFEEEEEGGQDDPVEYDDEYNAAGELVGVVMRTPQRQRAAPSPSKRARHGR